MDAPAPRPLSAGTNPPPISWREELRGHPRRWLLLMLAIFSWAAPLVLIRCYGVDMPWNDEWDLAPILLHWHDGTLGVSDFTRFTNEHRPVIPFVVYTLIAVATRWSMFAEMLFGWGLMVAGSLMLAGLCRATLPPERDRPGVPAWMWLWLAGNLLLMSPMQYENILNGFYTCNFIHRLFFLAALLILLRRGVSWGTFAACAALIIAASFSSATALLFWPLTIPMLAWSESWAQLRDRLKFVAAWIGVGAATVAVYFIGYQRTGDLSLIYESTPATQVRAGLVFLGNPLFFAPEERPAIAVALGALVALLFVAAGAWLVRCLFRRRFGVARAMLPWALLASYAVAAAVLAGRGRAGFGLKYLMASRYTTISLLLLFSLVAMAAIASRGAVGAPRARGMGLAAAALTLAVVGASLLGMRDLPRTLDEFRRARRTGSAMLTFSAFVDHPLRTVLLSYVKNVGELGLGLDALGYIRPRMARSRDLRELAAPAAWSPAVKAQAGKVEAASATPDGQVQIRGWAAIPGEDRPADLVLVTQRGEAGEELLVAMDIVGFRRPDIAARAGPEMEVSGFLALFPTSRLPAADRPLTCWAYDNRARRAFVIPSD